MTMQAAGHPLLFYHLYSALNIPHNMKATVKLQQVIIVTRKQIVAWQHNENTWQMFKFHMKGYFTGTMSFRAKSTKVTCIHIHTCSILWTFSVNLSQLGAPLTFLLHLIQTSVSYWNMQIFSHHATIFSTTLQCQYSQL